MSEAQRKKSKARIIKELSQYPIVGVACQRAGIKRATYYRWKNIDKDFSFALDHAIALGIENINDLAESKIIAGIKNDNIRLLILWLEHNHPNYKNKVISKPKRKDPVGEILKGFGLIDENNNLIDD